jgi:hypothetical protein
MRWIRSKRCWRYLALAAALIALGIVGFWLFVTDTHSPINAANFDKVIRSKTRSEVEAILGAATNRKPVHELVKRGFSGVEAIIVGEGFQPIPGMSQDYSKPLFEELGSGLLGDLSSTGIEYTPPGIDTQDIAEVHIWDGPEARIVVSFDKEGRLAGTRFIDRITWRYKLHELLPWLK